MDRRSFLRASAAASAVAAGGRPGAGEARREPASPGADEFALVDLHVHLTREFPIERMVKLAEEFMARHMAHCLHVLNREPIQIFGWPLFLPVCIARDYYSLWTQERMQAILSAAKARNIALEINDMSRTPDERFIRMAREQGLKFTFGSDARTGDAGRLSYCRSVARKCGLTRADFYVPRRKTDTIPAPASTR